jgi:hypothetical protein
LLSVIHTILIIISTIRPKQYTYIMAAAAGQRGKMMALLVVGLLLLAVATTASAKNNVELNHGDGEGRVVYADMRLAVHEKKSSKESSDAPVPAPAPAPEPSASDE